MPFHMEPLQHTQCMHTNPACQDIMLHAGLGTQPCSVSQNLLTLSLSITVGLPKQAETAVHALATPQAAPPQAAPFRLTPPPRWPCRSKQTANVTMLHGGGKKSGLKQAPQAGPPAGFAVKSSPAAPGGATSHAPGCTYALHLPVWLHT